MCRGPGTLQLLTRSPWDFLTPPSGVVQVSSRYQVTSTPTAGAAFSPTVSSSEPTKLSTLPARKISSKKIQWSSPMLSAASQTTLTRPIPPSPPSPTTVRHGRRVTPIHTLAGRLGRSRFVHPDILVPLLGPRHLWPETCSPADLALCWGGRSPVSVRPGRRWRLLSSSQNSLAWSTSEDKTRPTFSLHCYQSLTWFGFYNPVGSFRSFVPLDRL